MAVPLPDDAVEVQNDLWLVVFTAVLVPNDAVEVQNDLLLGGWFSWLS